uniref:Uncharacterized protein n=1 Tax=Ditylenchus dipsaci TaxID=166011 RepID=A0A915E2E7_9BILA
MKFTVPFSASVLKNPISNKLSVEQHRKQSSLAKSEQTMCIMGYFGNLEQQQQLSGLSNGYDPVDEHLLCQVTLQNERPDMETTHILSRSKNRAIRVRSSHRAFDESLRISKGENEGEEEGDTTQQKYGLFDLPEAHMHWMHYFINIEEGINFLHDGLFVEYTVELPANVQAVDKDQLNGRSQLCYSKGEGRNDVVRFSLPIQFTLAYPTWRRKYGEVVTWPRLLLRIVSEDNWHRFYIDGYASMGLPIQPGQYRQGVDCWRVVNPHSHQATMRELYLGQAVDLKNLELAGSRDANEQWDEWKHALRIMKVLNEFEHAKQQLLRLRTKKMPLMKFNG